MAADKFNLQRFIDAQAGEYEIVLAELRSGRKRGHWIWYIFPQIRGLGRSAMSERYAISNLDEAKVYLDHPILGSRLRECTEIVLEITGRSIEQIFPYPDDLKFRSCMTLFAEATAEPNIFRKALQDFFGWNLDGLTLDILSRQAGMA